MPVHILYSRLRQKAKYQSLGPEVHQAYYFSALMFFWWPNIAFTIANPHLAFLNRNIDTKKYIFALSINQSKPTGAWAWMVITPPFHRTIRSYVLYVWTNVQHLQNRTESTASTRSKRKTYIRRSCRGRTGFKVVEVLRGVCGLRCGLKSRLRDEKPRSHDFYKWTYDVK